MDTIRALIATIGAAEERLLSERTALEERNARAATYTTIGGLGLALMLLAAATVLLSMAVRERDREKAVRTTAQEVAAAVSESEARLRVTLASIGDAIIATDDDGRVTLMNGVAETLTGWTRVDAIGRPLRDVLVIVNEETRQPVENPVSRVLREGKITGLANHTVLISKAGREIPIDDSAAPIRASDDRLVGAVMVFRDVTGRRHAERERAALLEQERVARAEAERATRMLQHVHRVTEMAFTTVSTDGLMRELLAGVRTALATDTATILLFTEDGRHLIPVSSDGLRELVAEEMRIPRGRGVAGRIASSEAGMIFDDLAEAEVLSPFLRDRVKSLIGAPLRVGDRVIGAIHVGSSAPRQFTEDDLGLLRLVADRVAVAIERARLHEAEHAARREAEAANRTKDQFLAMLSHELRSPLNAIVGWVNVFRARKGEPDAARGAAEVIERNSRLLIKLVDDLLDVSRIVAGRLEMRPERVEVVPLVQEILETMRPAAAAKHVAVESVVDASSGAVWGDPARLHQTVGNLVANAIKFTPAGGMVEVRVQGGESHVQITVSDTGQGITPEFLPHVFERFRQEDPGAARTQGGLGLGLAIVRHLVEAHGGTVDAESPGQGQGARFTVRLPIMKDRS
jgi:PAS domain S-box-containing protein